MRTATKNKERKSTATLKIYLHFDPVARHAPAGISYKSYTGIWVHTAMLLLSGIWSNMHTVDLPAVLK
jgi:hypothetical protein